MTEQVLTHVDGAVLVVTINRPEAKNAMTQIASDAIAEAMDRLVADNALRCAVLTGAGGTFCSGMDLKGFLSGERPKSGDRGFGGMTSWTPSKPVIAAVDGYALAGGFELVLACDMVVASRQAKFGFPEAKRGLVAAGGGAVQLPRQLTRAQAMELALTGDAITAERAHELGVVYVVTEGPALDGALVLAQRVAENGPLALIASKAIIRDSWLWSDADILPKQRDLLTPVFDSEDAREGARAFAEKRKPAWKGR